MHPTLRLRGGEGGLLKKTAKLLSAPLWFFDKVDKEAFVMSIPLPVRKRLLRIMFWPTLMWTILLHNAMPDKRRWYDRVDAKVIIGALPLKRQLETLYRVERVTGVINCCDEFAGNRLLASASSSFSPPPPLASSASHVLTSSASHVLTSSPPRLLLFRPRRVRQDWHAAAEAANA